MNWAIGKAVRWSIASLSIASAAASLTGTGSGPSQEAMASIQAAASEQMCNARSMNPDLCKCMAAEIAKVPPVDMLAMETRGFDDPEKRAFAEHLAAACGGAPAG